MHRFGLIIALPLLLALAVVVSGCTVTVSGGSNVGTTMDNGSVYLGWHLFKKKKLDRETYNIGTQHGKFRSVYLTTNKRINVTKIVVTFGNGKKQELSVKKQWKKGHQTRSLQLRGANPRGIQRIDVWGRSVGKGLAKVEIYGTR